MPGLAVGILLIVCLPSDAASAQSEPADLRAIVSRLGEQAVESGQTVGLSVAVAQGESEIVARSFGLANAELDVRVCDDTVFRIGSVTKQFTAAAVLLLVDEGQLNLDGAVTDYLKDYPETGRQITIRNLLQHTSGLVDFTRLPKYRDQRPLPASRTEVLARFRDLPLDFAPGEKHMYCNSGYVLLAAIIEEVTGRSFEQFMQDRVFQPLGLQGTQCDSLPLLIPHRAAGYTKWGGKLRNAAVVHPAQTAGAGDITSTASDLVKWQRALMADRLLSPESGQLMMTRGRLKNGRPFNYGFGIRRATFAGEPVCRHAGGISGFRADLVHFPDRQLTIAVLANNDRFAASKLSDRIARAILSAGSKPKGDESAPKTDVEPDRRDP